MLLSYRKIFQMKVTHFAEMYIQCHTQIYYKMIFFFFLRKLMMYDLGFM